MKKLSFFVSLLLMLIVLLGLIKLIFNISGLKFYLELIVLLGLIFFGFVSLVLIYSRIRFGFVVYSLVSAIALINIIIIFYRTRVMDTLMFVALIASMTAFVIGIIDFSPAKSSVVLLEPYHNAAEKKTMKKKRKRK